ncbi:PREDICTED: vomeronasal type-1 receptor 1 [Propithecus coquereli]|uniref:vomeronasal type-1 receptor 1 n=1 Tax=Propithecus coquereli TaxID=379532 RepID=UPI00063F5AEC|nr:PREDICTED: vomeronasal type-1 receptor 1 [Propithecus coquereli]
MDGLVSVNLNWGITFLIQMGAGILGNSLLLCFYNFTIITAQILKPRDLILNQLVLANNLVLCSKGVPQTMAALGLEAFLDWAGCKLVSYLHRVARGVSLSTTCLLSGFQAIKLCPSISRWMEVQIRSPKSILLCCFLCWVLHLVVNIYMVRYITGPVNSKNLSMEKIYRYCPPPNPGNLLFSVMAVIYTFTDGMCLALMVWTSGSMVLVLHRHKQRVQHIRSSSLSPRTSHETRATHTILILVSMFVSFHALASILSYWITQLQNPSQWLRSISVLVASGFVTFSPFVFIVSDTRVSQFFACWKKKTNAPRMFSGL